MGCGSTLVKIILFVTNVIFALAGLALAGMGTAVLVTLQQEGLRGAQVETVPVFVIVVGAVAFVVACFGCCGAVLESRCMLVTYSVLLIVLMVAKTALATLLLATLDDKNVAIRNAVKTHFNEGNPDFGQIETSFTCCGTEGAGSYKAIHRPLTATCCPASDNNTCIFENAFPEGCLDVITDLVPHVTVAIAALCFGLVLIELVMVVFGLCLANHAGNKYKGRY